MKQILLLLLAAMAWPAVAEGQSVIPAAVITKSKASTVFIRTKTSRGWQTGSGFVIDRRGEIGLVTTNAHVIVPAEGTVRKIECVFYSGEAREFVLDAAIVAIDGIADLAVLSVNGPNLPDAIEVSREAELVETMPVLVLGYPFGDALTTSDRHPAITLSRSSVSSIRHDIDGNVSIVQLDGGIDPGNSGGPVINERGVVVGIVQAKVQGSQIGFAIPSTRLAQILLGHVTEWTAKIGEKSPTQVTVSWDADVADPKRQISEIAVATVRQDLTNFDLRKRFTLPWQKIDAKMDEQRLDLSDGAYSGTTDLKLVQDKSAKFYVQIKVVHKDGSTTWTEPDLIDVSAPKNSTLRPGALTALRAAALKTVPIPAAASPKQTELEVVSLPGKTTKVIWAAGGKYLIFHLAQRREALVYDIVERKIVLTVPASNEALLTAGLLSMVVLNPADHSFSRWSLQSLTKVSEGPFPIQGSIKSVAMGASSAEEQMLLAWFDSNSEGHLIFYDLSTMKFTQIGGATGPSSIGLSSLSVHSPPTIRAAMVGKVFGLSVNQPPQSVQEILVMGSTPAGFRIRETSGYVIPTPDGRYMCTWSGLYSQDGAQQLSQQCCLPTTDPRYYVKYSSQGSDIREVATHKVIEVLPQFPEFGSELFSHSGLAFDQRLHLFPEYELLVTVPITDDRLIVRKLAVPGYIARKPAEQPREWRSKDGRFSTTATFLSLTDGIVRLRKLNGQEIAVPLEKLSGADVEYSLRQSTEGAGR